MWHILFFDNFRFPGQYYDEETEFHYNYHRYYEPRIGRYLRGDPIGQAGGNNLYSYGGNNPINEIDQFGLKVMVGQHPAFINHPRNPFYHTVIVLIPDNPIDFIKHPNFTGTYGTIATLSAHAELGWNWSGHYGLFLTSTPNYPGDDPCFLQDLTPVSPPEGMNDTQFINALINADNSCNNDIMYSLLPRVATGYNSNSYVSGVITNTGAITPRLPGSQPGYNRPLPLGRP